MSFTPIVWADGSAGGTSIEAVDLNRIEQGIVEALGGIPGTAGDGVADDTAAINSELAAVRNTGGLVRGRPGSTYLISSPLIIGSNTVLDMTGCKVLLDPAVAQSNMLQNFAVSTVQRTITGASLTSGAVALTSATAAWTSADVGRSVVVPHAGWDLAGNDVSPVCARVVSVAGTTATLDASGNTTVAGVSVPVYDRDHNIIVIGGIWDAGSNEGGSDTVDRHILRFRRVDGLTVRDLRVECTGGKYALTPGDVTQVKIADVSFAVSSDGVHFHGPASGVTIRGVSGTTGDDSVALGTDDIPQYQDVAGPIRDVVVEDVDCVSNINIVKFYTRTGIDLDNLTVRNVRGRSLGEFTGITFVDGIMNNILVDGVNVTGPSTYFVSVMIASSSSKATVRNVVSAGGYLCVVASSAAVASLVVQGIAHKSPSGGDNTVVIDGTVTHLAVSDFACTLPTTAALVRMGEDATISAAYISDGVLTGVGDGAFLDAQVSSGTLERLVLRGLRARSVAFGFATQIDAEINISDVDIVSSIGLFYTNGGDLVIRNGQGITGTAHDTRTLSDAGTIAVRAPDFPIDLAVVSSRTTGDRAYNSNAALACGVGPVMWTGSTWQNLATGATYTPA